MIKSYGMGDIMYTRNFQFIVWQRDGDLVSYDLKKRGPWFFVMRANHNAIHNNAFMVWHYNNHNYKLLSFIEIELWTMNKANLPFQTSNYHKLIKSGYIRMCTEHVSKQ